jgi:hypothetical protein
MDIEQKIKKTFLAYGLILGACYLVLTIFSYYFITSITQSAVLFIASPIFFRLFVPVLITLIFCYKGRAKIGGLWTFKQATTGIFIMFFIAFLIQFIGNDIIFDKFIAPDSVQKTQVAALNVKTLNLKEQGYDQKTIDKNIAEMKKDFTQQTSPATVGGTLQEVIFSILFIFVFALIFGALFRNAEYVRASKIK